MLLRLLIVFAVALTIVWAWRQFSEGYGLDECTVLQTIRLDGGELVEIVDNSCKEGLPHTTGSQTIRMTRSIWEGARRDEVLTHERVHLAQKSNSGDEWADFYAREWEYTCYGAPPPGVPADLVKRLRPNPDTSDSPWAVWRGRWLFFPAFGEEGSLRNAEVIVWDLENHRQVGIPDEWRDAFCEGVSATTTTKGAGCPHQYEHPHEISAEWLAARMHGVASKAEAARKLFTWKK